MGRTSRICIGSWGVNLLVLMALPLAAFAADPVVNTKATSTWRTVAELTAAERTLVDWRAETPRDATFPYIPAERYPFEPPYTAEEMGYRAMEFSHSPRWSCNLIDVTGTLTSEGYLFTSKLYSPIFYVPNAKGLTGFAGELYGTKPGEPTISANLSSCGDEV